jgi:hypothetical protein
MDLLAGWLVWVLYHMIFSYSVLMVLSGVDYGLYRVLRLGKDCKSRGRLGNVDR